MLLTFGSVAVVLGGSLVLGTPLAWLLKGRKPLEEADWTLAPFLGVSAAVVVLQTLVFCDRPIGRVFAWLWAAAAAGWLWLLLSRAPAPAGAASRLGAQFRASLPGFPRGLFLAAVIAYAVHGIGLFAVGAKDYLGRGRPDQFNYTSMAQFLMDVRWSTTWASMGQRAYLADAMKIKFDRVGAELLQGFFAATIHADARSLFEPTSLLSPALTVLAVHALGRRLGHGRRRALLAGLAAGLLPGLAIVHLDCFLAHALAIPLLLAHLFVLHDLAALPTAGRAAAAALLLAATASVYAEVAVVLLGLVLLVMAGGVVLRTLRPAAGLLLLAVVPALALALNPLNVPIVLQVTTARITTPTVASCFENAVGHFFNFRGLAALWMGEEWGWRCDPMANVVLGYAVVMTALAALGLGAVALRCLGLFRSAGRADPAFRASCLVAAGVAALAALPAALFLLDSQHPYQVEKLVLTVCPLLALGAAHLGGPVKGFGKYLRQAPLAVMLAAAGMGTGMLAWDTTDPRRPFTTCPNPDWIDGYSLQWLNLDPDVISARRVLERIRHRSVVLTCEPGVWGNSWMSYAARQNDVWLVSPCINDGCAVGCATAPRPDVVPVPQGSQLIDLQAVPPNALLFRSDWYGSKVTVEGDCRLLWKNGKCELWELGPGPYKLHPSPVALRPDMPAPSPAGAPVSP
jgi:hypothetical protein